MLTRVSPKRAVNFIELCCCVTVIAADRDISLFMLSNDILLPYHNLNLIFWHVKDLKHCITWRRRLFRFFFIQLFFLFWCRHFRAPCNSSARPHHLLK